LERRALEQKCLIVFSKKILKKFNVFHCEFRTAKKLILFPVKIKEEQKSARSFNIICYIGEHNLLQIKTIRVVRRRAGVL
jgi:hypothetical protein